MLLLVARRSMLTAATPARLAVLLRAQVAGGGEARPLRPRLGRHIHGLWRGASRGPDLPAGAHGLPGRAPHCGGCHGHLRQGVAPLLESLHVEEEQLYEEYEFSGIMGCTVSGGLPLLLAALFCLACAFLHVPNTPRAG
jgi:hypothetical protein